MEPEPNDDQSAEHDDGLPTEPLETEDEQAPPKLKRSSDRVIFGVASGLGDYFKVDPLIIRVGLVVSVFFGGLGLLAYLGLAIFTPSEEAESFGSRTRGLPGGIGGVLVAIALVIGGLIVFGVLGFAAFFAASFGKLELVAIAIALFGFGLVVLARQGRGRWMALPLIALVAGGLGGAAVDLDLEGGIGEERATPQAIATIPVDGYRQGIGELAIDLRELDWAEEERLDLAAEMGIGELVIVADAETCIKGAATVGAGAISFAGVSVEGIDQGVASPPSDTDRNARAVDQGASTPSPSKGSATRSAGGRDRTASGPTRTLVIDAEVDLGEITVVSDDVARLRDIQIGAYERPQADAERTRNREACSG